MATTILSSVGSAIAGPLGASVGGFFGRQIDRQLRTSGSSRRITDLRIQNSSYGAEIPIIFGRLRVAGTVIWASDVVQGLRATKSSSQNARSVSFAVALTASKAASFQRIWADGRLIRGAAGDHKIDFEVRLLDGGQDQSADPLIASSEGIANTPAYRGLSLLVFENFDLGSFGNRIPQINVEIDSASGVAEVADCIASTLRLRPAVASRPLRGFALQGSTTGEALSPLVELYRSTFSFDDAGWTVSRAPAHHLLQGKEIGLPEMSESGSHAGDTPPSRVSVRYFDESLDFGVGEKSASLHGPKRTARLDYPGSLASDEAKALALNHLTAGWSERQRLNVNLSLTKAAHVQLGDMVELMERPGRVYKVSRKIVRGANVELELRRDASMPGLAQTDAGSSSKQIDVPPSELHLVLFEVPAELNGGQPTMAVGVAGGVRPYRRKMLDATIGGSLVQFPSADQESILGHLTTPLLQGPTALIDEANSIEVQLAGDRWLLSVDDRALLSGSNMALVGQEVIQFGHVEALGAGLYRLSRLIRGRCGSDVPNIHDVGSSFVLFDSAYTRLPLTNEMIGSEVHVTALDPLGSEIAASAPFEARSLLPLAPVHLSSVSATGSLQLTWVRRSRSGASWRDHVDAPLGEAREQYRITLSGSDGGQIEMVSLEPQVLVSGEALAVLGAKPWHVTVCQIGDFGMSRDCSLTISEDDND